MKNFNLSQFLGCCVIGISIVIAGWLISKELPNTTQLWQVQTIFSAVRNLMNGLKIELSKFQFIEQFIPQNYEFFKRTQKSAPDNRFWLPRASLLQVFVAGDDAAFEVDFDAIISDDDLFHQLLHDHAVICVHDCAALDVFSEAVQP